jgi:ribosomal protein S18 acetylase RimI-like enzyme
MDSYLAGDQPNDQMWVFGVKPFGFIHFGQLPITDRSWMVFWILADPHRPAKGVGTMMLQTAESIIQRLKGRTVLIETSTRDQYVPARTFYQRCGYELICTVPNYYAEGDSKCIFAKSWTEGQAPMNSKIP